MSPNPQVLAVVIPTRNEENYIEDCIRSVQRDCGLACQVVVVDKGSSDRTVEIAQQLGATVLTKDVRTIAAQRNLGAQDAKVEFIAFLDADCTVAAGWANAALSCFQDPEVVSAGAAPEAPQNNATWVQAGWIFLKQKKNRARQQVAWLASCNLWVRRSAFEACGGFDESFETCEDADLGFRIREHGKIISDPAIAVEHHREPSTLPAFYRKEVWHGKNSFDGVMKGRLTLGELPSLIAPLVCLAGMTLVLASLALLFALSQTLSETPWQWALVLMCVGGLSLMLLVPTAYTLRALLSKGGWARAHQYWLIYAVYFTARTDALIKWMFRAAKGKLLGAAETH